MFRTDPGRPCFCCPCFCTHQESDETPADEAQRDQNRCNIRSVESLLSHLVLLLSNSYCRMALIVLFTTSFSASLYVAQYLDTTVDITRLVPDDSHVIDFVDGIETQFGGKSVGELHIVVKDQDFSDAEVRNKTLAVLDEMTQQELSALFNHL